MSALRFDLVFSYWIYIWYILYAFNITIYSPKLALVLGLIDNIIMLCLMIYFGSNIRTILYFIIVNTFIKIVPLYLLRKEKIQMKDIYFTIFLFIVFIIWIHINKQSLIGNLKLIHDSLIYNKDNTPFMQLISKIEKNYKNLQLF